MSANKRLISASVVSYGWSFGSMPKYLYLSTLLVRRLYGLNCTINWRCNFGPARIKSVPIRPRHWIIQCWDSKVANVMYRLYQALDSEDLHVNTIAKALSSSIKLSIAKFVKVVQLVWTWRSSVKALKKLTYFLMCMPQGSPCSVYTTHE